LDKLHIWSLSFTLYFNLVPNFSIVSIWSLTFQCRVNLVPAVISWKEKFDVSNGLNIKKKKKIATSIATWTNVSFIFLRTQ